MNTKCRTSSRDMFNVGVNGLNKNHHNMSLPSNSNGGHQQRTYQDISQLSSANPFTTHHLQHTSLLPNNLLDHDGNKSVDKDDCLTNYVMNSINLTPHSSHSGSSLHGSILPAATQSQLMLANQMNRNNQSSSQWAMSLQAAANQQLLAGNGYVNHNANLLHQNQSIVNKHNVQTTNPTFLLNNITTPLIQPPQNSQSNSSGVPQGGGKSSSVKAKRKKREPLPLDDPRRKRRTRCGTCEGCMVKSTSQDCRKCRHCIDQKRYGGPGRLKKACMRRLCHMMSSERDRQEAARIFKNEAILEQPAAACALSNVTSPPMKTSVAPTHKGVQVVQNESRGENYMINHSTVSPSGPLSVGSSSPSSSLNHFQQMVSSNNTMFLDNNSNIYNNPLIPSASGGSNDIAGQSRVVMPSSANSDTFMSSSTSSATTTTTPVDPLAVDTSQSMNVLVSKSNTTPLSPTSNNINSSVPQGSSKDPLTQVVMKAIGSF